MVTIKDHFVTGPLTNTSLFRQTYTPRDNTTTLMHNKRLLDIILKTKELVRSHYSASTSSSSTLYFLSGILTQKSLYDEYFEMYDKDYKEQCS